MLEEHKKGVKVVDLCRQHGTSQPTFYQWQRKYSGLSVNELKRIKELEAELAQYKRIVAEQTLHITVLKDVIEKKL